MSSSQLTKILETICKKPENSLCADCNNKNPTWVSIDFGVLVCLNCSGAHRALGPSITRVRSTKLDVWNRQWIQYLEIGNTRCNQYLEFGLNKNKKPCNNSSQQYINGFVYDKYAKKKYINPSSIDPMERIRRIASGAKTQSNQQKKTNIPLKSADKESEKNMNKLFETNNKEYANTILKYQTNNLPFNKALKNQIDSLKQFSNTTKKPKKQAKQIQFDFNFQCANIKKDDFNQFSQSFGKFPLQRTQSHQHKTSGKVDVLTPCGQKQQKSCEPSPGCKEYKSSQQCKYTFDDIFTKEHPQIKSIRNADPFGVL